MDTMKDTKTQPATAAVIEEQRMLLNLAAKAAGYKIHDGGKLFWIWKDSNVEWVDWNPLTNDGDAMRLAVQLFRDIHFWYFENSVSVGNELRVSCGDDPCAATRRAIVRAAAEIGRNMK